MEKLTPTSPLWPDAMKLYEKSFPVHERRSPAAHIRAMEDPEFFVCAATDQIDPDRLAAILFFWIHDRILYVEHIAVDPDLRGKHIGSQLLKTLIDTHRGYRIILEIDPPEDETSVRRFRFYNALGFVANDYLFVHPSYDTGSSALAHRLTIMSLDTPLGKEEFEQFRKFVFERVLFYVG